MVVLSLSLVPEETGSHIYDKNMHITRWWHVQAQYSFFQSFSIFSDSSSSFFQLLSLASASIVSVFYILDAGFSAHVSSMLTL